MGAMLRAWIPAFVAFVLAAAGTYAGAVGDSPKFVVPNVPDLTIKTRETIDLPQSTVQINTIYFKGSGETCTCIFRRPCRPRERCGMPRSSGVMSDAPWN
jgi:hypothetical protein